GTLREPLNGWQRADVIMLTRSELVDPPQRAQIRERVLRFASKAIWVETTYAPVCLQSPQGQEQPLASLAGQQVAAFCGIGNPAGFRHSLDRCGFHTAAFREFADHHAYSDADLQSLAHWTAGLDVAAVVCTQKDLVKITNRW